MATIKLNVGGTVFETTKDSLKNSTYLTSFIERWTKSNEAIFIDRSPKIFEHVLAYLRDFNYPYPDKYSYELDFYGIKYIVIDKMNKMDELLKKLSNIETQMNQLISKDTNESHKCTNCSTMVKFTDTCARCVSKLDKNWHECRICTTLIQDPYSYCNNHN